MTYLKVIKIEKIDRKDRYDLTVNSTKNFFANGILIHNTSSISSYILCKRPLKWYHKLLKKMKFTVVNQIYDYIWSSRKVIKNQELNPNAQHYYTEDIWGIAHKELEPYLQKGMTIYFEISGYLPNGGAIQKSYDYGCSENEHKIFIYRITYTNIDGKVFEFSAKQVQEWCKMNGLNPVPELYYGYAKDIFNDERLTLDTWRKRFLEVLKSKYNEKQCFMCKNPVIEEGVVIRIEGLEIEVYKQKSFGFYQYETKLLDENIVDIESEN